MEASLLSSAKQKLANVGDVMITTRSSNMTNLLESCDAPYAGDQSDRHGAAAAYGND